jgi:hypothetical protein
LIENFLSATLFEVQARIKTSEVGLNRKIIKAAQNSALGKMLHDNLGR